MQCYFLASNKKVTKEIPGAHRRSAQHINGQNLQFSAPKRWRGLRSPRPPGSFAAAQNQIRQAANRNIRVLSRNSAAPQVSEGWYIGGGGFVKSHLLWRRLLILFLAKQGKYASRIRSINCNLKHIIIHDVLLYFPFLQYATGKHAKKHRCFWQRC